MYFFPVNVVSALWKYLESEGGSSWNVVRNCNVITTPLTANEKKVLLYSANLQVRGGFGDEAVRRQAIAEVHQLPATGSL